VKRLAVVISSFEIGGTEHQMSQLITRLDRRRFDVHPVCLRRTGTLLADVEAVAGPVTEFPLRSLRSPSTLAHLKDFALWCRRRKIEIVHACDIYANIFALPAAALARVPLRIGSRRGNLPPVYRRNDLLALQRLAYRFAHGVIANSTAAAHRLKADGVDRFRIRTIANGFDPRLLEIDGRRSDRRKLLCIGNLREGKGHDTLLKSFARLLPWFPDATLRLAGDGPSRPSLEALAGTLAIRHRVDFIGQCRDVPRLLAEADIFALASRMEASPNAVIEAMAAGLPVVATNVGGIPELIENGRSGLLVSPDDDAAMAAALAKMITKSDMANSMGEAARQTIRRKYGIERMVREFEALYQNGFAPAARARPEAIGSKRAT
jgi:L-malate glycosyltransferase